MITLPFAHSEIEFIEKKSRFIGSVWPVEDEEEAKARIRETNARFYDASHGVYAYDIKAANVSRFSDAGEPKGTAGMPVFEVFRREGITNYCCVVTRYFGGILLGAGGLVRAYAATAKLALDAAGVAQLQPYVQLRIRCGYPHLDLITAWLRERSWTMEQMEYGADVTGLVCVPQEQQDPVCQGITDLTAARASVAPEKILLYPVKIR